MADKTTVITQEPQKRTTPEANALSTRNLGIHCLPGDERAVGARIRAFRTERGLSLEDLASTANLELAFLESLESGTVHPSIGPLQKVARALSVRLGTFLDDQESSDPIICRQTRPQDNNAPTSCQSAHAGRLPRQGYIYKALGKGKSDRNMEPFCVEIFPANEARPKLSSHQGEEFIYVLEGSLLVLYGKQSYHLKAGESIYYNCIVPHSLASADEHPVRILAVAYNP